MGQSEKVSGELELRQGRRRNWKESKIRALGRIAQSSEATRVCALVRYEGLGGVG